MPRLTPTHIQSCLGVVGVVAGRGVRGRDSFVVWHVDEGLCADQAFGDVLANLGNLFVDVAKKNVGQPASGDHDGVGEDHRKVHFHGGSKIKQVGANLSWFEDKFVLPHREGGCTHYFAHTYAGKRPPPDSANDVRGHSGCCGNTRQSKITVLNSEPGMSVGPAWLSMALPRLVNFWRVFQLCWAAWRVW